MIVGAVAGTLILYNGIVDQAGTNQEFVTLGVGWYVGLLASLMIIAGGAISQIRRGGVTPAAAGHLLAPGWGIATEA